MNRNLWIGFAVVTLAAVLGVMGWRIAGAVADRKAAAVSVEVAPAPVSVHQVAPRDIVSRVSMTGTIRPISEAPIFTKVPGRVQQVLASVGDTVEPEQVLAVIEHREIQLQADQANAGVKVAEAQMERARIGLDAATTAHDRLQGLRRDDAIPQSEFEKVEYGLRDARASMLAAESGVATARAAAALARQMVENARVTTPIAGTVTHRFVNVGSPAGQTMPVFQVQDLSVLKLDCNATVRDFAKLAVGQQVNVTVPDLPGQVFPGTVLTLSPSLNPMTRHAAVEISINNPEGRLLPNMFATAVIDAGRSESVPAVPSRAVLTAADGVVVFVVRDGRAARVKPVLGGEESGWLAVESGLAAGDMVIVSGHASLKDGDPVTVVDEPSPEPETPPEPAAVKPDPSAAAPTDQAAPSPASGEAVR